MAQIQSIGYIQRLLAPYKAYVKYRVVLTQIQRQGRTIVVIPEVHEIKEFRSMDKTVGINVLLFANDQRVSLISSPEPKANGELTP